MAEPRYHHGNLRATLLEHAERVVIERGADALSLRELARVAGVSHGAPRAHFATRQDLLDAVSRRGFERLEQALREAEASVGPDFRARALAVSRMYVDFSIRLAALLDLMFSAKLGTSSAGLSLAESRAYAVFSDLLAEGQRAGILLPGTPDEVGLPFFAAIHGTATLLGAGAIPMTRLAATVDNVVDRALRGIAAAPLEATAPVR